MTTFRIAWSRRETAKSQAASIRPEAAIEADLTPCARPGG
jgi:hypothetical protein